MLSCSVSNTRTTGGRKETVGRFQAAHMRSPRKGSHSVKTVLETPTRRCATLCHGYSLKILSFWARDIIPMCWPNSTSRFHSAQGLPEMLEWAQYSSSILSLLYKPAGMFQPRGCGWWEPGSLWAVQSGWWNASEHTWTENICPLSCLSR